MLLSLDVGKKIVGFARSDPEQRFVFPIGSAGRAQDTALHEILAIISREKPEKIIVGLPLSAAGAETEQCDDIHRFCKRLGKRTDVPISFIDESYSTEDVIELLGLKGEEAFLEAKRSGKVDAAAAAIILRRYIESIGK